MTRGIHTEPWDKFVSVAHRAGSSAPGSTCARATASARRSPSRSDPAVAVFVPRGVGNTYQALEDGTAYSYLVNDALAPGHRLPGARPGRPDGRDPVADPAGRGRDRDKDRTTPMLDDVEPMKPRKTLIVGAGGQLGRALQAAFPGADLVDLRRARRHRRRRRRGLAVARVRRRPQRRRLHRRRRGRDARRAA